VIRLLSYPLTRFLPPCTVSPCTSR